MLTKTTISVIGILIALFFLNKSCQAQEVKSLSEVTITSKKAIIRQEIDRLIYDLQADPDSKSNSLLEMMKKIPMLGVDADDNLTLKGNSNYKILINGRSSSLLERNLKEVLRSMPASTIQRIEVITNPPSKYDAEGLAGIINIITNRQTAAGYSGTMNLFATQPTGGPGAGASIASKFGKFAFNVFTGGGIYNTPLTSDQNQRLSYQTILKQERSRKKDAHSGYLGTELSYEIDSLNLLSAAFNINGIKERNNLMQWSNLTGQESQQYALHSNNSVRGNGGDASLNYQLGFAHNKKQFLTLSYRFYTNNYQSNNQHIFSEQYNDIQTDFQQYNEGSSTENTAQIDYVTTVKKLGIELGLKGIFRNNSSDFQYLSFNGTSGSIETDPQKSNDFDNTQNVYAAYNTYQFSVGPISAKAGIRLEHTEIRANFKSNQTNISRQQLNLLPAVALAYKMGNASNINLGFNQRIQRPNIYQMNPFVDRTNPNVTTSGNPDLRPVVANAIQLGYSLQKKGFMNISLDYTAFHSLINQVAEYDSISKVTQIAYQNTGSARLFGANLSINYPITSKWNFSTNSKAMYGKIKGISGNKPISTGGFMYSIGLNSSINLEKGWRANASMNYKSKSFTLQRESNAFTSSSFGASKNLITNKLTVSASVSNPFAKYRSNIVELTGPGFMQTSTDISYFRSYRFSINYNFGKLKDAVKKSTRSVKNDDISN